MSNSTRRSAASPDEGSNDLDPFDSEKESGRQQERIIRLIQDLFSRWHWIALGLLLGVLGSLYYLSKAPAIYTAQARMLVKQQAKEVIKNGDKEDSDIDLKTTEALNTVSQQIKRFELLERVASRADVRSLPDLIPAKVHWLPAWAEKFVDKDKPIPFEADGVPTAEYLAQIISRNWLEVALVRNSRHIDIKVAHPSAKVAMVIANAIGEEYQNEVLSGRTDAGTDQMKILVAESERARGQLEKATRAHASYTRALALNLELETKEGEVRQLSRRYLDKHPKMMASQGELDTLQQRFLEEFSAVRKSDADHEYWDSVAKEIDSAPNQEAKLRVARQLLVARADVLQSEITSQDAMFHTMLTKMGEVGVNQQSTDAEVKLDSRARTDDKPTSPKKPLVLGAGAIGGLMLGLALAIFLIRIDNTFHTVAQIEGETGAPVLASISAIQSGRLSEALKKARKNGAPKPEGAMLNWNDNLVFRPGLANTPYAEMYRVLRASISLLGDESRRKLTLFTSALPGEGKSLTSANFALAAAAQGRKTLLIDLDLRKPNVHRTFGLQRTSNPSGGITECLAGMVGFEEAIYHDSGAENLDLILAGRRAPNPGELLHTGKLKAIFDQATAIYDCIVIDTAPLLAVPDTRVIAPLVDHLCIVTRAEFVPKRAVFRALETLQEDGTKPSGLVFNGFSEKRHLMGQNYSYGYYGRGYGYGYRRAYGRSYGAYGTYGADDTEEVEELVIPKSVVGSSKDHSSPSGRA